eukprot:NODE_705_length_1929_cov_217.319090_g546_i1.p1 GENE.NODE_705_length_1929_cov_217.319090_g546_i1~~NODE_705_length_1929_cov_217.319090_g546_i1.p1  ORF type:complete len:573 (+),score=105.60 NODE_705_length_1929_cov_217.319090_g546_i1:60-1721(+)
MLRSCRSIASIPKRAYATSMYFDVQHSGSQTILESKLTGVAALRMPQLNKGAAFTEEERKSLHLSGLLPPGVKTMEQQLVRTYRRYSAQPSPLEKYQYLRDLQERNEHLYFALVMDHLEEMMPIIYTPTVGDACRKYSHMYNYPRGLSFSHKNIDQASKIMGEYFLTDIRMIVATDSSAILGIGDQGYGGMGIPIGKLALYTAAGGVSPFQTCPVALDVGTNRKDLIEDPMYLGVRHSRLTGSTYMQFFEKFVQAVKTNWPKAIVQWEDLSKDAAFSVLERFRDEISSFNDDIQGTGAVTLGGVLAACKSLGKSLKDQVVVVSGAGAGGAGVALAIRAGMEREGLSPDQTRKQVLVLDSAGLLIEGRSRMEAYKHTLAQSAELKSWAVTGGEAPTLMETVTNSKATVLLGLSGIAGQFTEPVVKQMAANVDRPIIFCLSNPNANVEALPEDVIRWTDGKVLTASGSPFADVNYKGKNFPDYTATHWLEKGRIYPPIAEIRKVNQQVALRVMKQAIKEGVATVKFHDEDPENVMARAAWQPTYPTIVPTPMGFH